MWPKVFLLLILLLFGSGWASTTEASTEESNILGYCWVGALTTQWFLHSYLSFQGAPKIVQICIFVSNKMAKDRNMVDTICVLRQLRTVLPESLNKK